MQTITVEALKAKIDAGETLNLLDVREHMSMLHSILADNYYH
jgi:hypothetical protein